MRVALESNVRRRRSRSALLAILPSAAVPLLVMAWAVRPAVTALYVERSLPALDRRVQLTQALRRRIEERGLDARAAHYQECSRELRALVPPDASAFDLFHVMRHSALRADFDLASVQLGTERDLEWGWADREVRATEVHLVGRGTPEAFVELLDGAREAGRPMGVRSLDVSQRSDLASQFDMTAVLETYWSATAEPETSTTMDPTDE